VPAPPEPARNQPPPRPRPATPREQPRPDQPKPESPKPETPAAEPPKAEEPARPPTTLQTTPATAEGVVERSVRATLTRAGDELKRIDYGRLNTDARTQYDTAKRFIRQADDALRSKNLVFAKNLADKAVAIADQLGGR
jgi:outer membrane biosynthesis protein TonB